MRKVLVVDFGFLGDVLMTSPLIRALSSRFEVHAVGLEASRELFQANPHISHYLTTGSSFWEKLKVMMRTRYELAINVSTSFKTNLLMMGSLERLGYSYKLKGLTLTQKIPIKQRTGTHGSRTDEVLSLARALGIDSDDRSLVFHAERICNKQDGMIGFHVNPRHDRLRRWTYWGRLARVLRRQGRHVVYFGTSEDRDYIRSLDSEADIANTPSIQSLATWLTRLEQFVCVNSFPMHLARALHVPTLALIGGTPASVIVERDENFDYMEGVQFIAPGDVYEHLRKNQYAKVS